MVDRSAAVAALALGAAMIIAIPVLMSPTVRAMVQTWYESNSFNHCFLIVPMAAYLAWQRRDKLQHATVAPDWRGIVIIAVAAAAWLLGDATGTLIVQEISVVLMLQALVLAIFGRSVVQIFLFPLLYLYFAVPFGLEFVPPLQTATAFLAVGLLKLVGVPVFSDGYLISIPGADWYVADACSGVRYVISSLALGGLFAGLMYVSWWRRGLVLVVAIVVPILANGIRAFGIILLAYMTDNKLATGIDHLIYGWIFFTLVSAVVLAIGMMFREVPADQAAQKRQAPFLVKSLVPCLFSAALVLVVVGAARAYGDHIDAHPDQSVRLNPPDIAGYQATVENTEDRLLPVFNGADLMLKASYQHGDETLHLRLGYYLSEGRDAQAISPNHELAGAPEATIVGKGSEAVAIAGVATSVRYQRIFVEGRGRIIWYWFWVDGRVTGDPYWAKLLEAKAKLLGGRQSAAVIAIAADYRGYPQNAENALRDFARDSGPLYSALRQAELR